MVEGLAFTDGRTYEAEHQQVLNTAEDVLTGMGFHLRYRNPRTGRLLCHGQASATGATCWLDLTASEDRGGVTVRATADSYNLWSNRRLLDILGWTFHHLDVRMGAASYSPPPATGIGRTAPYDPRPSDGEPRPVLMLDPPRRLDAALLAVLPGLVLLGLASFQVEAWEDVLLVLAFASPYGIAALLVSAGLFRTGGAICIVFSIFAGMLFGVVGWLLVFATGEYAGRLTMERGRWWTFHRQALGETEGPGAGVASTAA